MKGLGSLCYKHSIAKLEKVQVVGAQSSTDDKTNPRTLWRDLVRGSTHFSLPGWRKYKKLVHSLQQWQKWQTRQNLSQCHCFKDCDYST